MPARRIRLSPQEMCGRLRDMARHDIKNAEQRSALVQFFWRELQVWLSVAWALNATLVLSFLQFDLLAHSLRI